MQYLDKPCNLMQILSKSDEKINKKVKALKILRLLNDCCHFEYLMRLYDVIKPLLDVQNQKQ